MSMRYKGAILSATPPTPNTASAPGEWTLSQQMQSASSWPIPGPFYIEDVFSTYLYTGNGSAQGIPNGIALANGAGGGTSTEFVTGASLTKTSDLTGDADGQTTTVSFWIKTTAANGEIFINQNSRYVLNIQGGLFWFYGKNTGDTTIVSFKSSIAINTGAWVNVIFSFNLSSTSLRSVYINDVADTGVTWTTYTDATMDRATTTGSWFLGNIGAVPCKIANFYMANTYTDLSVTANRRYFIDADGTEAAAATTASLSPILYLPLTTGYSTGQNLGTGGNFTAYLSTPAVVSDGPANFIQGYGGLTWIKSRTNTSGGATSHVLVDTARGSSNWLATDATSAQATNANLVTGFTSAGFSVGNAPYWANENGIPYASWTFRKQPKFFDVVTYTGNGATNTINHNLGAAPGCIIIKSTSIVGSNWFVYHRSLGLTSGFPDWLILNSSGSFNNGQAAIFPSVPTSTSFQVGSGATLNQSGQSFVAYLFAHDAGGFGSTSTDNVISCGSFTTNGSGVGTINLGYEPQWILVKTSSTAGNWLLFDTMRGLPNNGTGAGVITLYPNNSDAEATGQQICDISATGVANFIGVGVNTTCIYIAIRRGPMKTPTSGTSVFSPNSYSSAPSAGTQVTTNFPVDWQIKRENQPSPTTKDNYAVARLLGVSSTTSNGGTYLLTNSTQAETATGAYTRYWNNTGFQTSSNDQGNPYVFWSFGRAPGFFDVVCYTGTGVARTVNHNLGAVPELMIVKQRSAARDWVVYIAPMGNNYFACLNDPAFQGSSSAMWNDTTPTNAVFTVGTNLRTNVSGGTYVAYLFASCPGVSKVGSYTGTGATQTISCGFTGGARFVLIKRTDSTGDWYVWDSARGMVAGTDPSLLLNSTAAQVNANSIYTTTGGFQVVSTAAGINASGGTYIYLAIA